MITELLETFKRKKFRRLTGGLSWPTGVRPGYCLIVGEKIKKDQAKFYVVAELETADLTKLVTTAFDFQQEYKPQAFYTDFKNGPMVHQAIRLRPQLILNAAPYSDSPDNLQSYVVILQNLMARGRKRVFFNKGSNLPRLLADLTSDRISGSASAYPYVAALAYAVLPLEISQPGGKVDIIPSMGGGDWPGGSVQQGSDLHRFLMMDRPGEDSGFGGDW